MVINFRTLRLNAGLTCKEIADSIGIKETTLKKYECSDRMPPNSRLIKLEEALKCSKDELMAAYAYHKEENLYRARSRRKI